MAQILVNKDGGGATTDILPYVRAILGFPQGDATRDTWLAMLAENAMGKYCELAPRIERYPFTTVQNQQTYNLPTDLKEVLDVFMPSQYGYYNDTLFLPMIDTPSSSLFGYSDYAFRSPSERLIRQGILNELDHYATSFTGYKVELGAPPVIYLFPSSVASGLNVIVRYAADHQNQSSDPTTPTWNTLPPGHWRHIITLLQWAVMQARASTLMTPMGMSGTDGGGKKMSESWQLLNASERFLSQVRMALGSDRTIAIRGPN